VTLRVPMQPDAKYLFRSPAGMEDLVLRPRLNAPFQQNAPPPWTR